MSSTESTTRERNGKTRRQALAELYVLRARVDREIARAEAEIEHARALGRLKREHIEHGDESAYQRHIRKDIPFPEDAGEVACGCRMAHARYERARAARADAAKNGVQTTIYEVLGSE